MIRDMNPKKRQLLTGILWTLGALATFSFSIWCWTHLPAGGKSNWETPVWYEGMLIFMGMTALVTSFVEAMVALIAFARMIVT